MSTAKPPSDVTNSPLAMLPPRAAESHKGDYGRVLVLGGSRGMSGAPARTAMAARRAGAGLVTVATPYSVQGTVAAHDPCYTSVPLVEDDDGIVDFANVVDLLAAKEGFDVWAVGPGLGQSAGVAELVAQLYREVPRPMVVDADGLNALAAAAHRNPRVFDRPAGPRVLTPHPGEFARLTGASAIGSDKTRPAFAAEFAERDTSGHTIVVLKGHRTIIAERERYAVNQTGNPGMATGGTGDCLTGIVAALLAQGMPAWDAARLAVHVHGDAGDLAAAELGEVSLIATDLIRYLPKAFVALKART